MLKTDINIRNGYKYYKNNYEPVVEEKEYVYINNDFNKFLVELILDGYEVTLPARMGTFFIAGRKVKVKFDDEGKPNLAPDWVKTKELWEKSPEAKQQKKLVYLTNEHTDGIIYKIRWSKKSMLVPYKSVYSFRAVRDFKRSVWDKVSDGKEYRIKKY